MEKFTDIELAALIGLIEDQLVEKKPDGNFRNLTEQETAYLNILQKLVNMQMVDIGYIVN